MFIAKYRKKHRREYTNGDIENEVFRLTRTDKRIEKVDLHGISDLNHNGCSAARYHSAVFHPKFPWLIVACKSVENGLNIDKDLKIISPVPS